MPDDPRVRELLDELADRQATPEEVCAFCPELLSVVRARWRQICQVRVELDALLPVAPRENRFAQLTEDQLLPQVPGYEVDAVLGHGRMGIVFRARHVKLSRLVALKMTLAGSYANERERERFRREAEAVAALRHANIVQVYDVGDLDGRPYFTMELIEGGSLAQRQGGVPQPAHSAAALLATLAEAVHAAHQGGIVHRDLKPANILFTPEGRPKITDFGLALRVGSTELTLSGVPLGTPSYMAPEQARGQLREIGPAADVYALGAILYELLTGRPPYRGGTPAETLLKAIHHELVPPARLNRKVPRDLQTICLKCLQKDPQRRYVTAAALADDLQYFLRGEAIAARPEAYAMRWVRRICRQPILAGAVMIAVLSTLAFAGGGIWVFSDRSAKTQAAHDDLRDMVRYLNESAWHEASAARDRASGRLGNSAAVHLRQLIDQGTRNLALAARLEAVHLKGMEGIAVGVPFATYDREFVEAFSAAELGTVGDSPEVVASRIRESHIRGSVIAALDRYSTFMYAAKEADRSAWALAVARQADANQSNWRLRARDQSVLQDTTALNDLIATMPDNDPSLTPLLAIETYVSDSSQAFADRLAILKRLHNAYPDDFWLNLRIGGLLRQNRMYGEALGYLQAATSLRPESPITHVQFGGVLSEVGRHEESAEQYRRAAELNPAPDIYHQNYVRRLSDLGRHEVAITHLEGILRSKPDSLLIHKELARCCERQGQDQAAITWLTKTVELDPQRLDSQKALRDFLLKRERLNDLQAAWKAMLAHRPLQYSAWYGYAELCLFVGKEDDYRLARSELLRRFAATTDTRTAEQVSRLSLLSPTSTDELKLAVALSERALAAEGVKSDGYRSYYLFARGLAQYRQGQFDQAIATMKGDASRVLGPAPRLVLAMALYRQGEQQAARQTLAAAVTAYDWRANLCKTQDAWIFHVLRREAEQMILLNLSAFLADNYQPQDIDERLALVGICQFTDRTVALAQLYESAFTADPSLLESSGGHRLAAARAMASAGCGRGADAVAADDAERVRWRVQAVQWLQQELASIDEALSKSNEQKRTQLLQRLRQWQTDDDFAGLRDPNALEKLPADEQERCRTLWGAVQTILTPAQAPR